MSSQAPNQSFAEKKGKAAQDRNRDKVNQGLSVMKSKSLLNDGGKQKAFPTDQEIEFFQAQLNSEKI